MLKRIRIIYFFPKMKKMEKRKVQHLEGSKSFSRRRGKVHRKQEISKKLKVKKKRRQRNKKMMMMKHLKKKKLHQRKRKSKVFK
jgi:peptide deformylase